ncbi:MAG: bis(5'-nucleosyl)-tetraphosphatase (symmetrical) YqeK [Vampirovibrionia bacterium]
MTYTENRNTQSYNIEEIKEKLQRILPAKRYLHSVGTEEKARELARQFGADEDKAAIAGLLHDCAKFIKKEEMFEFLLRRNIHIIDDTINSPAILHALASEYLARHEYHIDDPEILSAISNHTLGNTNMKTLDKIVFVADKIEDKTRNAYYFDEIRTVLNETNDLDAAILVSYAQTIKSLVDKNYFINYTAIRNWNYLLEKTGKIKPIIKNIGLYKKIDKKDKL